MNSCHSLNRDTLTSLDVPLPENIFANSPVFVPESVLKQQQQIITAIESVVALSAYQNNVLTYAPETALFIPKALGVFFGYDFHIDEKGNSKLIEINTNAGGALLNALEEPLFQKITKAFLLNFQNEWQLSSNYSIPLKNIAIVDESPTKQYLYPEFVLFKRLFEQHGIQAIICAPEELRYHSQKLWYENTSIDLIYNRLTDFSLQEENQKALMIAYLENNVVITPHPRAHALYANKRNLTILSNAQFLGEMGVDKKTQNILINGIATTIRVEEKNASDLWSERKKLFFKPEKGYGSKATYRGDKLTKRVFDEILVRDYVAQSFVPPQTQQILINDLVETFKFDLRAYVYNGKTQLTCARLYQGQTTNFRTKGGGFAPVFFES